MNQGQLSIYNNMALDMSLCPFTYIYILFHQSHNFSNHQSLRLLHYILFFLSQMGSIFSPLTTIFLLLLLVLWGGEARDPFACDPKNTATKNLPFCKASLATGARVKDLIGRLTLQEKVNLLVNNAAAVPRLGIKGYEWWSEALHGVSNVGPGTKFGGQFPAATSFPQVITTAASFNASLWEAIGRVSFFFCLRANIHSQPK